MTPDACLELADKFYAWMLKKSKETTTREPATENSNSPKTEKKEEEIFDPQKSIIRYGKYKGSPYKNLSGNYLNWLYENGNDEEKAKLKILSEYLKKSPENEEQEDEKQETMNGDPIYEDDLPF